MSSDNQDEKHVKTKQEEEAEMSAPALDSLHELSSLLEKIEASRPPSPSPATANAGSVLELPLSQQEKDKGTVLKMKCHLYRLQEDSIEWSAIGNDFIEIRHIDEADQYYFCMPRKQDGAKFDLYHPVSAQEMQYHADSEGSWIWTANDFSGDKPVALTYAVKFKTVQQAEHFKKKHDEYSVLNHQKQQEQRVRAQSLHEEKQKADKSHPTKYGWPLVTKEDLQSMLANEIVNAVADDTWTERYKSDKIVVWTRLFENTGNIQVKAQAVVRGHTPEKIFNLIYDLKRNSSWGNTWKTLESLENLDENNECIYMVLNTPFGVSYRDFIQFRSYYVNDDKSLYMIGLRNGSHPSKPEQYGMVRGETLGVNGYIFRSIDDGSGKPATRVTLTTAVDVKGYVPKALFNWICARNPKTWSTDIQIACDKYA